MATEVLPQSLYDFLETKGAAGEGLSSVSSMSDTAVDQLKSIEYPNGQIAKGGLTSDFVDGATAGDFDQSDSLINGDQSSFIEKSAQSQPAERSQDLRLKSDLDDSPSGALDDNVSRRDDIDDDDVFRSYKDD